MNLNTKMKTIDLKNIANDRKDANSSSNSINNMLSLRRYSVICQSCYWSTRYAVRTNEDDEQLDISHTISKCPVCKAKSIESHLLPQPR